MSKTCKWKRPLTERLISLLKENTNLYDVNHEDYRNGAKRSDAIRKISIELGKLDGGLTNVVIRTKIHTLRSQYLKEQRKVQSSCRRRGKTYSPALWCYDKLDFLNHHSATTLPMAEEEEVEDDENTNNLSGSDGETKLPTAAQWTREVTTELIRLLQAQTNLYDINHADYRNQEIRSAAIQKLTTELQHLDESATIQRTKLKIHTLRSQYMKQYQKIQSAKRDGKTFVPTLWCYDALKFLNTNSAAIRKSVKEVDDDTNMDDNNDEDEEKKLSPLQWSRPLTKKLIDYFRKHINLYDINHIDYKNGERRLESISQISIELRKLNGGVTNEAIKIKIHTLRSQYRKEYRKIQSFARSGKTYFPTLWCFDQLDFLQSHRPVQGVTSAGCGEVESLPAMQWTRILTKKLIGMLWKNEILYNSTHPDYENAVQRFDALHQICLTLREVIPSVTIADISAKIESLRSQFLREHRKLQSSMMDSDEIYVPALWCYGQLEFLYSNRNTQAFHFKESTSVRDTELCRLCANFTNPTNSENLFEQSQQKRLHQIEALIGVQLKNTNDLPQLICKACEEQILHAHQFRKRCIQAQQHFTTEEYKEQIKALTETTIYSVDDDKLIRFAAEPLTITEDYDPNGELKFLYDDTTSDPETTNDVNDDIASNDDDDVLSTLANNYYATHDNEMRPVIEPLITIDAGPQIGTFAGITPRICDQCGKYFKDGNNFKDHMRRHVGVKEFQCDQCSKMFMTKPELKLHRRIHTGEKPYSCRYCSERFKSSTSKILHERRVHTHERPFACNVCGKTFIDWGQHKDHLVTHSDERPFSCEICSVSFRVEKTLKQHYRSMSHKNNAKKQPH